LHEGVGKKVQISLFGFINLMLPKSILQVIKALLLLGQEPTQNDFVDQPKLALAKAPV
jgi:hypothetical protein